MATKKFPFCRQSIHPTPFISMFALTFSRAQTEQKTTTICSPNATETTQFRANPKSLFTALGPFKTFSKLGAGERVRAPRNQLCACACSCTSQHVIQWNDCKHEWTRLDFSIAAAKYVTSSFVLFHGNVAVRLFVVYIRTCVCFCEFFVLLLLSSSARAPILINPTVRLSTHFVVKQINEPDCLKKCSQAKMA